MTTGVTNNWPTLGVTGRVDVEALTVGGNEAAAITPQPAAGITTVEDLVTALVAAGVLTE